ncbi:ATP synthase subunit I [Moritella yayanosii]|uniref:F0F1 ATP synthase subunit I n=1 Tax=Moritella yayanosii TaxID=69539 RepID=A0A330LR89_9GAMM|nr:ATP synthase subunit I [Moritella yayanosii]SQD79457.1 F0F1 ATP synthase subunit I [Moritella yayanosii]
MSNKLAMNAFNQAVKLIVFQVLLVAIIAMVFLFIDDGFSARSAVLGGMIYVLPNYIFTRLAFRFMGARQIKDVAASFALGESLKLVLTVVFFIVVLGFVEVNYLPLYVTFALAISSQLFAPYFMNKKLG